MGEIWLNLWLAISAGVGVGEIAVVIVCAEALPDKVGVGIEFVEILEDVGEGVAVGMDVPVGMGVTVLVTETGVGVGIEEVGVGVTVRHPELEVPSVAPRSGLEPLKFSPQISEILGTITPLSINDEPDFKIRFPEIGETRLLSTTEAVIKSPRVLVFAP